MKENGLTVGDVKAENGVYQELIHWYCRESGVRSLKKTIEKIFRKVAYKLAIASEAGTRGEAAGVFELRKDNLKDLVGFPAYSSDKIYDETPPGVVMGLAWTGNGTHIFFFYSSCLAIIGRSDTVF